MIYFYPRRISDISVELNFKGKLLITYPEYDTSISGWKLRIYPDGRIKNKADKQFYSYLFWDGQINKNELQFDLSEGFVVSGKDTRHFLREKLSAMGLNLKESNEMIVYWLPQMEVNAFNLIHFAFEEYEKIAELKIKPSPTTLIRIFMVFKPLPYIMTVKPQKLPRYKREGFVVVEWGGMEVGQDVIE